MPNTVLIWDEKIPAGDVRAFFNQAGYREGKDYRIGVSNTNRAFIKPLTQIFLAQDSKGFGFKSVEMKQISK